ncbi:O-antigen ligase family protein [Rivularia sp. UHCC 0363]|uniref:O-antigen ligase family protein n=1 Tax=Rivularia sp. UHCC 0363 TaxID=3110244 RepID=UPI002B1EC82B|nr:O-antigen ligase family protein [Rivularia sp. UHCC 0363]MEA5595383.1 O-antigen ligase family protein [Rivularia sp. UHCC 0363]
MKKQHLEIAEKIFVIIGLTFFSGGFAVGSTKTSPGIISESIISIIRYFVWSTSLILICFSYKRALHIASKDIFIWILTAIVYSSSIWSVNPEFTEKFMPEVLQMTSFGLYFATRFSLKQQVRLVAWTFGLGAILSMLVVWRLPSAGLHWHDHPGAWKGIYDYKNTFGSLMVLSSIAFLLLPINNLKHRRYKWAGFVISLLFIIFSTSKTSIVVSFVTISIVLFYQKFRWKGKVSVFYIDAVLLFAGSIATIVIGLWVEILGLMGKDATLTGRTPMWNVAFTELMREPWFGFGRGAFWAEKSKYAIEAGYAVSEGFVPPHAHNGFIDIMLDVGFVGFFLFLISFGIVYFRSLKLAYGSENLEDMWPLAYLLFLTLNNMMESYLLRLANVYWVLYIAVAFSVRARKTISINTTQKKPALTRFSQRNSQNAFLK